MKLDKRVLIEILEIVRSGFAFGVDISQKLRDLDLDVDATTNSLCLSADYLAVEHDHSQE